MTKAQITGYKKELANDFKDISKKYMEQLVKVKASGKPFSSEGLTNSSLK